MWNDADSTYDFSSGTIVFLNLCISYWPCETMWTVIKKHYFPEFMYFLMSIWNDGDNILFCWFIVVCLVKLNDVDTIYCFAEYMCMSCYVKWCG